MLLLNVVETGAVEAVGNAAAEDHSFPYSPAAWTCCPLPCLTLAVVPITVIGGDAESALLQTRVSVVESCS